MTEIQDEKLLDHDYDGIQELDNPLPRWWVYLFYLTIVFSIIYFIYYTFGYGDSLSQSHAKAVNALTNDGSTAELTLQFNTDKASLERGRTLFIAKCAACHKADGGGLVGPNLTDNYWINGTGSNEDIYDVILKGVPEKGMIPWENQLSSEDIQALTVYIQSLKGTKPEHAKAAEGSPYN